MLRSYLFLPSCVPYSNNLVRLLNCLISRIFETSSLRYDARKPIDLYRWFSDQFSIQFTQGEDSHLEGFGDGCGRVGRVELFVNMGDMSDHRADADV